MTTTPKYNSDTGERVYQRWQRVAWVIAAADLATDAPAEANDDAEARDWRDWAERVHGAEARKALAIAQAIKETDGRP